MESRRQPDGNSVQGYTNSVILGDIDFYEVSFFSWIFFPSKKNIFFNISKITSA